MNDDRHLSHTPGSAGAAPRHPSRREMLALGLGVFLVGSVPFAARSRRRVRRSAPVMGTIAELAVVHSDPRYAHAAMEAAIAELSRVDRTMSRHRPDSFVGRVNAAAGQAPVTVDGATVSVVREALRWAAASEGRFDPTLGRAMEGWDFEGGRGSIPSPDFYRGYAGRQLWRGVEVGTERGTPALYLDHPEAALDLGGIAKGFGVDRAVEVLRDWGITDGLVNVGGDLYALGRSEDGDPWSIGVRDPADPDRIATAFRISDGAVATSGDYLNGFDHQGRRYHHLLDPETGEPRRTGEHSLTVLAADVQTADAAATTLFGLEATAAASLLERVAPGASVLHRITTPTLT